jgi:ornithine decarboxylase
MTTNPINTLAVRALAARHHRSECDSNSNTGSRSCDHTYDRTVLEPGCSFINEDPFYIVDLGVVASQLERWRAALPRVIPYYAVKCNPDPVIVQTLALLGCSFDCASRGEISLVQNVSAELPDDVPKPDIIFANPCKGRAHIIDAVCRGVQYMTFDNVAEIHKCASVSKRIKLVLRIFADDSGSQIQLSTKFGAPRQHWNKLLVEAKQAGLEVVGVSFHVGCGCRDVTRYEMALRDAKEVFEMARRDFGFEMRILDIGGGFPGETLNSVTVSTYHSHCSTSSCR